MRIFYRIYKQKESGLSPDSFGSLSNSVDEEPNEKESNKNWTTCLRLNTEDGSPRVFLLNSHFLGSVPKPDSSFLFILFPFSHLLL